MPPLYALIPARAGSSRIPNKNLSPFHGKPLISWTIEYARKTRLFQRIYVSTDFPNLPIEITKEISLLNRPEHLANSFATLLEVILYTAAHEGWSDDTILALLLVTGPLRVTSDLTEGLRLFQENNRERTVVSVSENLYPPGLLWTKHGDQLVPLEPVSDPRNTRKQGHPGTFMSNDILVLDSLFNFKKPGRNLFGFDPIPLIVPAERCMPIDYPVQLELAKSLFPPFDERISKIEWKI